MNYRSFGRSDIGNVRENNEDELLIVNPDGGGSCLFVVADGVGGARHGALASELAAATIHQGFLRERAHYEAYSRARDRELRGDLLLRTGRLVEEANTEVFARSQADEGHRGMSSTSVALVAADGGAFLGHVGDSRAYLLRGDVIYRLTEDHTWANLMVKQRRMSPEVAASHHFAHVLTRSLGTSPHVEVDTTFIQVEPGDRFVLCTDGLHRYLPGRDVLEVSAHATGPTEVVEKLIREAKGRGGRDNVTVVCVEAAGDAEGPSQALRRELELLKSTFLFDGLTDQEVMRIMRILYKVHRRAGERIITEGDDGRELYIISEGAVDVTLRGAHLSTIGAGGHFGELALIDNEVRSATVTARTDVTLLRIEQADFTDLLRDDDELGRKMLWRFLRSVTQHLRALSRDVASLEGLVGTYNKPTLIDYELPESAPGALEEK